MFSLIVAYHGLTAINIKLVGFSPLVVQVSYHAHNIKDQVLKEGKRWRQLLVVAAVSASITSLLPLLLALTFHFITFEHATGLLHELARHGVCTIEQY